MPSLAGSPSRTLEIQETHRIIKILSTCIRIYIYIHIYIYLYKYVYTNYIQLYTTIYNTYTNQECTKLSCTFTFYAILLCLVSSSWFEAVGELVLPCLALPHRVAMKRPASHEEEKEPLFGEWIDPRPKTQPGGAPLLALNGTCQAPLGVFWNCDFLSMEIAPSALPCFASSWEIGGSLQRSPKSQFPSGLEISSKPFTLRLRSILHDDMNGTHEQLLIEAGEKLRKTVTQIGKTGHPILAAHPEKKQQAFALAMVQFFSAH